MNPEEYNRLRHIDGMGQKMPAADYLYAEDVKYDSNSRVCDNIIPKKVHQIWLGPKPIPTHTYKWKQYCEHFGWEYKLWDDASIHSFGLTNVSQYIIYGRNNNYHAQADIARYEIVNRLGGFYFDADIVPANGTTIDVSCHLGMRGLICSTENHAREITTGALFVMNSFFASCADHPILKRIIASIPTNISRLKEIGEEGAMWCTGPFLFNKCLFGPFTIIHRDWTSGGEDNPKFQLFIFKAY